uniref:Uncharacterized protein n=1 Tax=Panagrolaimus superbus TaxID=310955 RepID=A0A914YFQ3_9BILA
MKEEELYCNYWRANTWKTFVKTRFCAECIEKYKMEAKELHLSYKRKVDDNDDDGQENDEMNEEDVVEVQQIYNDDAETIWPVYTEPRPCSSQRKFKKAQRLNVDQNSVNNFIVNSQITSDRQLLSMEVDGSTESVSQGLNTLININENQIQNAQSINAGIQYGNSENQRHGLHIPRINASFSQTYQFPNHQPQQHTYLHTTNPQLIQQYDIHGIPVPPQIYPGTTSTTTYFSTPQNYALPQSSQCESLPQQHFSATETMPIMPSHVVSQSLLPP